MQLCAAFALVFCGLALLPVGRASRALRHSQAPVTFNPVSGVVELLRDMKKQLEEQAAADEEVWEKLDCWCITNDKGKTKAIADAQAHLSNLATTIERTTALSASLTVEIQGLEKEIEKNQQSLDAATALRKTQHDEFIGDEKEMVQSIVALDAAITVLEKHHGTASSAASSAVLAQAARVAGRHAALLQGRLSPQQRHAIEALAQETPGGYFDATPTFKQAYQPQSGEIFGILREMKNTFEADLSASRKDEIDAQTSYDSLKAAKENQIQIGQAASRDKQQQLADADDKLAQSKQDREDTEASLSADQKFLVDLKLKCSMTDKEWTERKITRQTELAAVSEAIAVLSSDDARDLASRTFNPVTLLQTGRSFKVGSSRDRAASVLAAIAARTGGTGLAALVQIDPFTQVKQAIDDMVVQLLKEKDLEVKHRDWCIEELNTNQRAVASEVHAKAASESKIQGLEVAIAGLNGTIETFKSEVSDLELQQQRAKEDRELEQKEFDATVADQRKVQQLLEQALTVLRGVYGQAQQGVALSQFGRRGHEHLPAEPQGFEDYEHHKAGGGVIAMIEHIIANAKAMEVATMKAETEAKDAYTSLVQETTNSVRAKQDSIVDRKTELVAVKEDLLQVKAELADSMGELQALSDNAGALHGSCDFIMKNFDKRQAARDEEVAALRQAKAYLSGARL